MMDASTLLAIALGAAAAGFVQGLSGFGFGLTAMSLWAWTLEPLLAAALSVFGSLAGQVFSALSMRRGFDWPRLAPFVLGGLLGLPLGLWLLPRLDVHLFKAVLGLLLVVCCPLLLAAERMPRVERGGAVADGVAGALGGFMGGLGGFTGVAPTLWCTLRGYSKDAQRAVIQNFNLAMLCATFAGYVAAGHIHAGLLPQFALVAPLVLVSSRLGARVYARLSDINFRRLVLGLLTASGVALLAAALPALLRRL